MKTSFRFYQQSFRHAALIALCGSLFFGSSAASAGGLVLTSEGRVGSGNAGESTGLLLVVAALAVTAAPFSWTTRETSGAYKDKAFHQRFSGDPRGVSKDLMRRRGKHYLWVKKLLRVPPRLSIAFDCSVADRRAELKARLKKAKSMNPDQTERVMQLIREAYKTAKKRPTAFDACQLKFRYFEDPKTFKAAVLGPSAKGTKRSREHVDMLRWIMNTYLDLRGVDTRYLTCQFRADRGALKTAFERIEKTKTRNAGFKELTRLLKRGRSFAKLPIIKRTQCWKKGTSLQTQ